jgi:hypothetical protein
MHIGAEAARVHNRHSNQMLYPSYPTTKKTRGMVEVFSKKKLSHPVDDEKFDGDAAHVSFDLAGLDLTPQPLSLQLFHFSWLPSLFWLCF